MHAFMCVWLPRWTQIEGKKFFMAPSLAVAEGKLNTQATTGWANLLNYDLVGQIGTVTIGYETAQTLLLRKILVRCGQFMCFLSANCVPFHKVLAGCGVQPACTLDFTPKGGLLHPYSRGTIA